MAGGLLVATVGRLQAAEEVAKADFPEDLIHKIETLTYDANDIVSVKLDPMPSSLPGKLVARYFRFNDRGIATNAETKALKRITPFYPPSERALQTTDTVKCYAIIARDGSIQDIYVRFSHPNFARSAALALRSWKFESGEAERLVVVHMPFSFSDNVAVREVPDVQCSHPEIRSELLRLRHTDQQARRSQIDRSVGSNANSLDEDMLKIDRSLRWTPKTGQAGSLTQTQENDPYVKEETSAQRPVKSPSRA